MIIIDISQGREDLSSQPPPMQSTGALPTVAAIPHGWAQHNHNISIYKILAKLTLRVYKVELRKTGWKRVCRRVGHLSHLTDVLDQEMARPRSRRYQLYLFCTFFCNHTSNMLLQLVKSNVNMSSLPLEILRVYQTPQT